MKLPQLTCPAPLWGDLDEQKGQDLNKIGNLFSWKWEACRFLLYIEEIYQNSVFHLMQMLCRMIAKGSQALCSFFKAETDIVNR